MIKRTAGRIDKKRQKGRFDPKVFLNTDGSGHAIVKYRMGETIFSQGSPADLVFYVLTGKVKVTVVSEQGKEAVVAILGRGRFLRRGMPGRTAAAHGDGLDHGGVHIHAAGKGGHGPRDP